MFILLQVPGASDSQNVNRRVESKKTRAGEPDQTPAKKQPATDPFTQSTQTAPPLPPHEQKVRAENIAALQQQLIATTISNDGAKTEKTIQILKELRKLEPDRVPLSGEVIDKYTAGSILAKEEITQLELEMVEQFSNNKGNQVELARSLNNLKTIDGLYNQFINQSNKAKKITQID